MRRDREARERSPRDEDKRTNELACREVESATLPNEAHQDEVVREEPKPQRGVVQEEGAQDEDQTKGGAKASFIRSLGVCPPNAAERKDTSEDEPCRLCSNASHPTGLKDGENAQPRGPPSPRKEEYSEEQLRRS